MPVTRKGRPVLEMRAITKRFPGVVALHGVSFDLRKAEVHLLLGENGAGKSTLMKILSGAHRKDSGTIAIEGKAADISSPLHARQLGISMIYQEMNLVPGLTVADNIFLGREPARMGFVRKGRMEAAASLLLKRLHSGISPATLVRDLPVAQQQMVEISKALSMNARILVMDEPTSPLSEREVKELFGIIRSLKRTGVSVIYITHRLEEARMIGDRVTVLRDGRNVGTRALRTISDSKLVSMMVGRKLSRVFPALSRPGARELLTVQGLARRGFFGPASFALKQGEILGLAGLIGSGRTELVRALVGADPVSAGTVKLDGRQIRIRSPRDAKNLGICLLPEDRKAQGLILGMNVLHNVSLPSLRRLSSLGFIRGREEKGLVSGLVRRLNVRTPGLDQIARNLSGGNQQKLVLAKWLGVNPKVLIFDEPTRGIDVGAKFEVYKLITALARQGAGIIFISSELPEVLGLSHRVGVMRGGRLAAVLPRRQASAEKVMHHAMGVARA